MDVNLYFDEAIDIHHIFPKAWCEREGIAPEMYNSIINKTPLTARTNRVIGGRAPSDYLERLSNSAGVDPNTTRKQISTHLADGSLMALDDFNAFFTARARALLDKISSAMGKPIDDLDLSSDEEPEIVEEPDDTDDA